jgi:class 3 adenylate cyclase
VEQRNADLAEARRIQFRIGVNLGDIIIDADDIYGDGVNIAARLEALAEPCGCRDSRTRRCAQPNAASTTLGRPITQSRSVTTSPRVHVQ